MESSSLDFRAFAFIITLAAVVNGLGIVRWLTAFSEFLRRKRSLDIQHYWVFNLLAGYQFLLHILMWWTLWGARDAVNFNFLTYLYLLTGPVLLFLGTSLLTPNVETDGADVRDHFSEVHPTYSTVLILLWIWAIFAGPILRGFMAPTVPLLALFLAMAVALRATSNPKTHGIVVILNWLLVTTYAHRPHWQTCPEGLGPATVWHPANRRSKHHISRTVECRLRGILQYADDEADRDHLHCDIVRDAK